MSDRPTRVYRWWVRHFVESVGADWDRCASVTITPGRITVTEHRTDDGRPFTVGDGETLEAALETYDVSWSVGGP